jgi:hypothetical protein
VSDFCDHKSVGVIIEGHAHPLFSGEPDTFLLFERVKPPVGMSFIAGHVDDLGGFDKAMAVEADEEAGVTLTNTRLLVDEVWRNNRCRRQPSGPRIGHTWKVVIANALGNPRGKADESKNLHWYTREELQDLAVRTALRALNYESGGKYGVTAEEFRANPGIEPVWVEWLWRAELVNMSAFDREAIDLMAARAEGGVG